MERPAHPCLGIAEIESLAAGEEVSAAAKMHIATCKACAMRVEEARQEAAFVNRARTLTRAALGPEGSPRIPGYQTLGILSSGAQGVVYRARQESTSRTVAIKALIAGDAATARQRIRAEREAEIAARLRHSNIVTVFESRTLADGRIAVVMEFVDGVPLDVWKPPGLTPGERRLAVLRVFMDVCRAIHHAHLNGVIHRDLKPDNILVTADGRPVVLDFGIAAGPGIRTTQTGEFAGTPAYVSPEQVSGKPDEVDALTDVYALGVILYRLLCDAMPYELDGSLFEIARIVCEEPPKPPRLHDPSIPADLEAIILRAIAKEKDRRYQSAASFARDIERYLDGAPVEARSGSGWYLLRKAVLVNRHRLALAGGAVATLLGAGVAVAWSLGNAADSARQAEFDREQARAEGVRARAVTELIRAALPNAELAQPDAAWLIGSGLGRLYYRLETGAFEDDPDLDQALRRMWGSVYTDFGSGKALGLVEYAEVAMRSGLVALRTQHGAEHPEIAATLHELAGVTLVRQRVPEAVTFCQEALAMREKLLGPDALATADTRALLARALLGLGDAEGAVREAERALQTFRTLTDQEADLRIAAMTALEARVWISKGDAVQAEAPLRESLIRRFRRLPPEDPDLLASLADAADFVDLAPDAELAQTLRLAWADAHDDSQPGALGAAIRNSIPLYREPDRGNWCVPSQTGRTRALGHLLDLQQRLLGADDPSLLRVLIAQMGAADGERVLAAKREAALLAAAILTRRRGEFDRSVLSCIEEAAVVYGYEGRADEAVKLTLRAQRIHESPPREMWDLLIIGNSLRYLGWFLALDGRHEEAVAEYRRAIDTIKPSLGPEHHVVALAEAGLAASLANLGEMDEADRLSAHAIQIADRSPNVVADQFAQISFARGRVLLTQGQWAAAKEHLEAAWSAFYRCVATTFPWRIATAQGIALCCENLGDPEGAAKWRQNAVSEPQDTSRPTNRMIEGRP